MASQYYVIWSKCVDWLPKLFLVAMGNGSYQSLNPLYTGLRPWCNVWGPREIIRMLSGHTNPESGSPQWSLFGRYWSAKGGTMVVQGRQKDRANWHTMFTTEHILRRRPMADHYASILQPWRCMCLPPACHEWPVSDRPPRQPSCDCFSHAQNFAVTMAFIVRFESPVHHPWATNSIIWPPLCL